MISRSTLRAHAGSEAQLGGVRRVRLLGGPEAGSEVVELATGPLRVDLLASRGLDLGAASYRGRSLCWLAPAGIPHPAASDPHGEGWLHSFGGGLLTTCGLLNVGRPGEDEDGPYGLHGRASNTPAQDVAAFGEWHGDEYRLTVRGVTHEAVLYGHKLRKTRTVTAVLGSSVLEVEDVVENLGGTPAPLALLYHLNLGWPLLGPGARLRLPGPHLETVEGEDPPEDGVEIPPPDPAFRSQVTERAVQPDVDGWARARLAREGLHVEVAFDTATLPRFTLWRQFGYGDYLLGLEPGTVGVRGRATERERGTLPFLPPGNARRFRLRLSVGEGA